MYFFRYYHLIIPFTCLPTLLRWEITFKCVFYCASLCESLSRDTPHSFILFWVIFYVFFFCFQLPCLESSALRATTGGSVGCALYSLGSVHIGIPAMGHPAVDWHRGPAFLLSLPSCAAQTHLSNSSALPSKCKPNYLSLIKLFPHFLTSIRNKDLLAV